MKETELKQKKEEALYALYKQGLEEGRFSSLSDAGRWVASSPAPCFFTSARQASLLLGRIEARVSLINLSPLHRKMTWKLWENYNKYLDEHPDTDLPRIQIVEILVDEPAPEFYITEDGARRILREKINKVKAEIGW